MSVAPLHVAVMPLSVGDDFVYPVAEQIWNALADAGVGTVIDDRVEVPIDQAAGHVAAIVEAELAKRA